jgi:hypothetical protein
MAVQSVVIRWETPPPPAALAAATAAPAEPAGYTSIADELRPGDFQAVVRRKDGISRVYARYLGDGSES